MISYNQYISKHTRSSELRSRFVYFVESGFRHCPINRQVEVQPNLRNYKLIAALGYLDLGLAPDLKEIFENGIEWIIGRQIDSSEPMIYDNVAIMGLMAGVKQLPSHQQLGQRLLTHLEKQRNGSSASDMVRFWNCWFNRDEKLSQPNDQNLRLLLFRYFENKEETDFDLIKGYHSIKRDHFPYVDEDDLFMNVIAYNNVEFIERTFVLNHSKLEEVIEEYQYKALRPLLERIDRRSKSFSKFILSGLAILTIGFFCLAGYFVWTGDWDFLEPKTFIFFGTPLLGWIVLLVFYLFTEKELTLNPRKLAENIINWRKEKLRARYGVKLKSV